MPRSLSQRLDAVADRFHRSLREPPREPVRRVDPDELDDIERRIDDLVTKVADLRIDIAIAIVRLATARTAAVDVDEDSIGNR